MNIIITNCYREEISFSVWPKEDGGLSPSIGQLPLVVTLNVFEKIRLTAQCDVILQRESLKSGGGLD